MNHLILRRIAAATAVVCETAGGGIDLFPLIKALYVSDRQMLIDYARPITGDFYSSMEKGPILSRAYDFLSGKSQFTHLQSLWNEAFLKTGNRITTKKKVNIEVLSMGEVEILQEKTNLILGVMKTGSLAKWMHEHCPEWEAVPKGKSKPLPMERVIKYALHVEDAQAQKIKHSISDSFRTLNESKFAKLPLLVVA